jgi:hypothetical protein
MMKRRRMMLSLLTGSVLALGLGRATPLRAEATTDTINVQVPIEPFFATVPCANGGAGEDISLTGTLHVLIHTTQGPDGKFLLKEHAQPQGISAVGLITGDIYRATGVTQDVTNDNVKAGETTSFVNNFRMIGPGTDNNLLIHEVAHATVHPDGTVSVTFDRPSVECR